MPRGGRKEEGLQSLARRSPSREPTWLSQNERALESERKQPGPRVPAGRFQAGGERASDSTVRD